MPCLGWNPGQPKRTVVVARARLPGLVLMGCARGDESGATFGSTDKSTRISRWIILQAGRRISGQSGGADGVASLDTYPWANKVAGIRQQLVLEASSKQLSA